MVDQTSVTGGAAGYASKHGAGANGGVAEFLNDVGALAELQARLASLNLEEATRQATVPISLIVMSLTMLAAGMTVALIGSALLLTTALRIHQGWAMILTAGVAIALAGPVTVFALARLRSSLECFRPSREELRRNLTGLQAVLISREHRNSRRNQ
jgi:Putative Actinobacterial Holin-X, holin superfamily III